MARMDSGIYTAEGTYECQGQGTFKGTLQFLDRRVLGIMHDDGEPYRKVIVGLDEDDGIHYWKVQSITRKMHPILYTFANKKEGRFALGNLMLQVNLELLMEPITEALHLEEEAAQTMLRQIPYEQIREAISPKSIAFVQQHGNPATICFKPHEGL